MEVLIFGGLPLIAGSILFLCSRKYATEDNMQQAYVTKGLALAFFAVGAFNAGRGMLGMVTAETLNLGYLTMDGWIFAVPLLLVFLFRFSRRRKIQQVSARFRNDGSSR